MPDFNKRATGLEIMDDFSLGADEIDPLLGGLEKVNQYLGGYKVVFSALKEVSVKNNFHISDWGCGGGDVLRAIEKKAEKQNLHLQFTGIDATPAAVNFANRKNTSPQIRFILADVLSEEVSTLKFDIVLSTLFTHHFEDEAWILLIKKMINCSRRAVIIDDLHRHWFAYYAIKIITRIVTRSRLARYDGPLSVLRGFKRKELESLLQQAGIKNYNIKWMWAFRWRIILYKS
ncbi:MAG: methyltransferase domain-containing protein [Mucilaginibacter sp.]|uniref:methyltransferase domain-containing protein n=1 Tax=Mucilaginibacter sp. TaxID=1882438 RepID=UPI0034E4C10C